MLGRAFEQKENYDILATNRVKMGNIVSFNINSYPEIFTWQRLPFYNVSTLDSVMFIATIISPMIMRNVLKDKKNVALIKDKDYSKFVPSGALVKLVTTLYSIQASHPTYCITKQFIENRPSKSKPGITRKYVIQDVSLYDNDTSNKKLLCTFYIEVISLDKHESNVVADDRKKNRTQQSLSATDINIFAFATPYKVGQLTKKCVFLSDLQFDIDKNNYCAVGLIGLQNGFDSHPWIPGSGNHINSNHSMQSFIQFIYLLVRNSQNISNNPCNSIDSNFKIVDKDCFLSVVKSDVNFDHYVELGNYKIELIELKMINNLGKENISVRNAPYTFRTKLKLVQNNVDCVVGDIITCPVFSVSKL
eukprot:227635_1